MQRATRAFGFAVIGFLAVVAVVMQLNRTGSVRAAEPAQDVMSLDRRINSFEQRLYLMESHINQLQQQIQYAQRQPSVSSARDPEADRLRLEVNLLQARLAEIECGVKKLDERTLPASARTAQKPTDPCRLQPNTPVQLSNRQ